MDCAACARTAKGGERRQVSQRVRGETGSNRGIKNTATIVRNKGASHQGMGMEEKAIKGRGPRTVRTHRDIIVRHTFVSRLRQPFGRATLPATPPLLRGTLPRAAHHSHRRLDLLGFVDLLLDYNLDRGSFRDVSGGRRRHDVGCRRSDTTSAGWRGSGDLRRDRVVLGVSDSPGLGRNLNCGLRKNDRRRGEWG